jgi:hypothetical protein
MNNTRIHNHKIPVAFIYYIEYGCTDDLNNEDIKQIDAYLEAFDEPLRFEWGNDKYFANYNNVMGNVGSEVVDVVIHERIPLVDNINPSHYKKGKHECITYTEQMDFCNGNAFKYVYRAGEKGDKIEDLKKAQWYLNRGKPFAEYTSEMYANLMEEQFDKWRKDILLFILFGDQVTALYLIEEEINGEDKNNG